VPQLQRSLPFPLLSRQLAHRYHHHYYPFFLEEGDDLSRLADPPFSLRGLGTTGPRPFFQVFNKALFFLLGKERRRCVFFGKIFRHSDPRAPPSTILSVGWTRLAALQK